MKEMVRRLSELSDWRLWKEKNMII